MPDGNDITVNTPEGDKLHFPVGTDQQTIVAAMGKLKMQKAGGQSPEQAAIASAPNPAAQAHQQTVNAIPVMQAHMMANFPSMPNESSGFVANGPQQISQTDRYNEYQRQSGSLVGTVAGAMATGGLSQGPGVLKLLGRAGATGAGVGVGSLAGGATPKEAAVNAVTGAVAQPIAEGGSKFLQWLTASKSAGSAALQQASAKAGSAPVELSPKTDEIVEKMVQRGKLGDKLPKVISDLLERVGPTTKVAAEANPGPLTYDEARILQGNISSLTPEEQISLKGAQKGLIKQLAGSFSSDVQKAADAAGAGEEHAFGMKEFATASARNRALTNLGKATAKYGGQGVLGATGAGAAYGIYRLLKGQR